MIRRRVIVHGLVQGVGYRAACAHRARLAGVAGWVRNRPDDTVEAVFEGDPAAVGQLVDWARVGPPAARVRSVDVVEEPPEGLTGYGVAS